MIRDFSCFFKHKFNNSFKNELDVFAETSHAFSLSGFSCPACAAKGNCHEIKGYDRTLVVIGAEGEIHTHFISVRRICCDSCLATHALLPSVIVPYSVYSILFMMKAIKDYYHRAGTTVVLLCEKYQIAVSTLYEWLQRFRTDKKLWLGILADMEQTPAIFLISILQHPHPEHQLEDFLLSNGHSFLQNTARCSGP